MNKKILSGMAAASVITAAAAFYSVALAAGGGMVYINDNSLIPFENTVSGSVTVWTAPDEMAVLALYGESGRLLSASAECGTAAKNDKRTLTTLTPDNSQAYSEPISRTAVYIWNKNTHEPVTSAIELSFPVIFNTEDYDDSMSDFNAIYAYIDGADTPAVFPVDSYGITEGLYGGFFVNGSQLDIRSYEAYDEAINTYILSNPTGIVKLTDTTGQGYYTSIYVTKFSYAVVESVSANDNGNTQISFKNASAYIPNTWSIDASDSSKNYSFTLDGSELSVKELKEDDVLSIEYDVTGAGFAGSDFYNVTVSRKTIREMVQLIEPDEDGPLGYGYFLSDNNWYKLTDPYSFAGIDDIIAGGTYIFYLDASGRIIRAVRDNSFALVCVIDSVYTSNGDMYYADIFTNSGEKKTVSIKNKEKYLECLQYCFSKDSNGNIDDTKKLPLYDRVYGYKLNSKGEFSFTDKQKCVNIGRTELVYNAEANALGSYKIDSASTALLDIAAYNNNGAISAVSPDELTDGKTYRAYIFLENPAKNSYLAMLIDADIERGEDSDIASSGIGILDTVYVSNGDMYYANIITQLGEKKPVSIKNYESYLEYLHFCYSKDANDNLDTTRKLPIYERVYNYKINTSNELIIHSYNKETCLNANNADGNYKTALEYNVSAAALGSYKLNGTYTSILNISDYDQGGTVLPLSWNFLSNETIYDVYVFGKNEADNSIKLALFASVAPGFNSDVNFAVYSHFGTVNTPDGEKTAIYAYIDGASAPYEFLLDDDIEYVTGYSSDYNGTVIENVYNSYMPSFREGDAIILKHGLNGYVNKIIPLFRETETLRNGCDNLFKASTVSQTALSDIISTANGFAAKYFTDSSHEVYFKFGQIIDRSQNSLTLAEYTEDNGIKTDISKLTPISYSSDALIYSYDYNKPSGSRIALGSAEDIIKTPVTPENNIIDWSSVTEPETVNYALIKVVDGKADNLFVIGTKAVSCPVYSEASVSFKAELYDDTISDKDTMYAYLNGENIPTAFKLDSNAIYSGSEGGFYVNGRQVNTTSDNRYIAAVNNYIKTNVSGDIELEDINSDGLYDKINVTLYRDAIVESVLVSSDSEVTVYFDNMAAGMGALWRIDASDSSVKYDITMDGKEISAADLKEGDILSIAYDMTVSFDDSDFYTALVSRNTAEGTLEKIIPDDYELKYEFVLSDGNVYKLADPNSLVSADSFKCGKSHTLYLNAFGRIVDSYVKRTADNICIIDSVYITNGDMYYADIFTQSGEKKTVSIAGYESYIKYLQYCYSRDANGNIDTTTKLPIYERAYGYKLTASNYLIISASDKEYCRNLDYHSGMTYRASTNKLDTYKINNTLTALLDISDYETDGTVTALTSANLDEDEEYIAYILGKNSFDNSAKLILIMPDNTDVK